jgi:hypothetical protein
MHALENLFPDRMGTVVTFPFRFAKLTLKELFTSSLVLCLQLQVSSGVICDVFDMVSWTKESHLALGRRKGVGQASIQLPFFPSF